MWNVCMIYRSQFAQRNVVPRPRARRFSPGLGRWASPRPESQIFSGSDVYKHIYIYIYIYIYIPCIPNNCTIWVCLCVFVVKYKMHTLYLGFSFPRGKKAYWVPGSMYQLIALCSLVRTEWRKIFQPILGVTVTSGGHVESPTRYWC